MLVDMLENEYINKIRPVSISIIRREHEILVYKRNDDMNNNESSDTMNNRIDVINHVNDRLGDTNSFIRDIDFE